MNREIKFRFWDKDLKKMCYRKPCTNDFNHKNIIPMQFTGCKDAKGNEIYENDICETIDKEGASFVVFSCGTWRFNSWMPKSMKVFDLKENIIVIGNMIEDKEKLATAGRSS